MSKTADDAEREIEERYKKDVEEVRKEITETVDLTIREKAHENLLLKGMHSWFGLFFGSLAKAEQHLPSLTNGKYTDITKLSEGQRTLLQTIKNGRIIPVMYTYLDQEYKGFRFDMLCGNYEGALRTLRWMLETAIHAVEFQTDQPRATIYRDLLVNPPQDISMIIRPEDQQAYMIIAFEERMIVMEKYRRPTMQEILSKIPILKNSKEWKKTDPSIDRNILRNTIHGLYALLSRYAHYSKETTLRSARHRIAFLEGESLVGRYNKLAFSETYTISMNVLDSIVLLLALLDAWYFGYQCFHEYVRALNHEFGMLLGFIRVNEIPPSYLYLPKTKEVIVKALSIK